MTSYMLFLIVCLILNTFCAKHPLASETEGVVGGYPPHSKNHKHHAAIIGKENYTNIRIFICNGAIIGDFFILSAYYCVFNENHELKSLTFFALVGSVEISSSKPRLNFEIESFIMTGLDERPYSNELLVLKLKQSLELMKKPYLAKVQIPDPSLPLPDSPTGAGFGIVYPTSVADPVNNAKPLNRQDDPVRLNYAFVKISENEDCKTPYNWDQKERSLYVCGVIEPDARYSHRGFCTGDIGAPLVSEGQIFGMLRENRRDCDDTKEGAVYMNVPKYKHFIDGVLSNGESAEFAFTPLIVPNNPYVSRQPPNPINTTLVL